MAQGEEIRRGRGVQAKHGDEAKPLDMERWQGGGGTDDPEGYRRRSTLAGMPVVRSPREQVHTVPSDRPHRVYQMDPAALSKNKGISRSRGKEEIWRW